MNDPRWLGGKTFTCEASGLRQGYRQLTELNRAHVLCLGVLTSSWFFIDRLAG